MAKRKLYSFVFLVLIIGAFSIIGVNSFQALDDSYTIETGDVMCNTYDTTTELGSIGLMTLSIVIILAAVVGVIAMIKKIYPFR